MPAMRSSVFFVLFFFLMLLESLAQKAQADSIAAKSYSDWLIAPSTQNNKRVAAVAGSLAGGYTLALVGLNELWYKDYPRSSFHFINDMGEWNQIDKAGHIVTPYLEARYIMQLFQWTGMNRRKAAILGGATAFMFQNTIEVFDGFSAEWGASGGDIVANFVGAAAMTTQELVWGEQRISLKVMPHFVNYSDPELQQRADELYGKGLIVRFIKDYNAINVWASINTASFFPKQQKLKWLNVAIGYGAGGMFGGYSNEWTDSDGVFHRRNDVERYRKIFLSVDIDFHRIPTKSRYLRVVLDALNILKVPAPAIEFNSKGQVLFHPLM